MSHLKLSEPRIDERENRGESDKISIVEETDESSNVLESTVVMDMTGIYSYCVRNPCRRLKLITNTLRSLGLEKISVRFEHVKIDSLQDKVIAVRVLEFSVMACAHTISKARDCAAEMMLMKMGFSKSKPLLFIKAKQKASVSFAFGDLSPLEREEEGDVTELFSDIFDPVIRLETVVHSMCTAEMNLTVVYETHEHSNPLINVVKCTVDDCSTIASENSVSSATRSASMLMLLRLGLKQNDCFLSNELKTQLKMISDENMSRIKKSRIRLFPSHHDILLRACRRNLFPS